MEEYTQSNNIRRFNNKRDSRFNKNNNKYHNNRNNNYNNDSFRKYFNNNPVTARDECVQFLELIDECITQECNSLKDFARMKSLEKKAESINLQLQNLKNNKKKVVSTNKSQSDNSSDEEEEDDDE